MKVGLILASVLAAAAVPRQDTGASEAGVRLEAIFDEYEAAMERFEREWKAASEQDRPDVRRRLYIVPDDELVPRVLAIVADHPGSEIAARGLAWVARVSRGSAGDRAALALVGGHLDSMHTVAACERLSVDYGDGAELLLRVATESPLRELRGHARLSLAGLRKELVEITTNLGTPQGRAQYADWYGEELVERLSASDPEALVAACEADYRVVLQEYADVEGENGPLGPIAERDLHELLYLRIGARAPEIVGKDLDGVEMRLSDYRGKVVVLDFWGHW